MSLALEPLEPGTMTRPPRPPREGVLTGVAVTLILAQGAFMAALTLGVYLFALSVRGCSVAHAESLACLFLIVLHLTQAFLSRSLEGSLLTVGVLGNRWLVAAVALSLTLLCAGDYIPGVNTFFGFVPLTALDWAHIAVGVVALVLYSELLKLTVRQRHRLRAALAALRCRCKRTVPFLHRGGAVRVESQDTLYTPV